MARYALSWTYRDWKPTYVRTLRKSRFRYKLNNLKWVSETIESHEILFILLSLARYGCRSYVSILQSEFSESNPTYFLTDAKYKRSLLLIRDGY